MRVLLIVHRFFPAARGCSDDFALSLAKAAQRAGHSARILVCSFQGPLPGNHLPHELPQAVQTVSEGVPVILMPHIVLAADDELTPLEDERVTVRLSTWMQHQEFDLVHFLHPMHTVFAVRAAQRGALPFVVSLTDFLPLCPRTTMLDADWRPCPGPLDGDRCARHCLRPPWTAAGLKKRAALAQEMLAIARIRVCPSPYAANRYRKTYPDMDFTVVPRGLDLQCFTPPKHGAAAAEHIDLTLGYLGNAMPQQGLTTLLRALASLPEARLRLVVISDALEHEHESRQLIAADPRVQLITDMSPQEVARLLPSLDLLCLPLEGVAACTWVLDLAAAAGVPALVADLGAPGEWMAQHGCGLLLPPGESDAWARAIGEIASRPEQINAWRANLPLPLRIEEETFFYDALYRCCLHAA